MVPGQRARTPGDQRWLNAVDRFGDYWMLGVFVIMVLVFGFLSPSHDLFTRASWLNISQYAVEFLLLAIGQTFVIITGGIDLSDGAVLGFTGMVSGVVMQSLLNAHTNVTLTTVAGFATALAVGRPHRLCQRLPHHPAQAAPLHRHPGQPHRHRGRGDPVDQRRQRGHQPSLPDRHHRPDPDRRLDLRPGAGGRR